jgi:hypothetical protein
MAASATARSIAVGADGASVVAGISAARTAGVAAAPCNQHELETAAAALAVQPARALQAPEMAFQAVPPHGIIGALAEGAARPGDRAALPAAQRAAQGIVEDMAGVAAQAGSGKKDAGLARSHRAKYESGCADPDARHGVAGPAALAGVGRAVDARYAAG